MTFYLTAAVIYSPSIAIYKIFLSKYVQDIDLDFCYMSRSTVNMPIDRLYMNSGLMAIVVFSEFFTVSEMFTVEMCVNTTFRMDRVKFKYAI